MALEYYQQLGNHNGHERTRGISSLPRALAGKYPKAGYQWAWQFVFPSAQHCKDPYTGRTVRFHVHEKTLQRTVKEATRRARIAKPVGCHTFRHAFATHLLEAGNNIRLVQQLMGHKNVETTMVYTHVMSTSFAEVRSPADALPLRMAALASARQWPVVADSGPQSLSLVMTVWPKLTLSPPLPTASSGSIRDTQAIA